MNSIELVSKTIKGMNPGRTPVYGWVSANLKEVLDKAYGSVEAFEDHYEFDMAHIFGGPGPFGDTELEPIRQKDGEVTPEAFLEVPLRSADRLEDYADIIAALKHHRDERQRFCYLQTPGIFECLNGAFGIEDHLCWLALYPDELKQVYHRQALWNRRFAENAMDLGVDMVHVSDDWGGQNSLLFSREMWCEMIRPNHKITCDAVKARGKFLSLHSDGHVMPLMDDIVELGYDVFHPWQETANMPYKSYLEQYSDKLAILGGLCIQSTIGFGNFNRLEQEIRRVFSLLKGKRWMFCTTHFVQEHCSLEELVFAFDLAVKLARD
jgi:uroporphyrinogen decarboxylase